MSHAMAKAVGFLFFFPLLSVLLLLGNVKLGLAIILPILLGFGLLLLSKNLQIRESFKHYQKLRDNSESFQEAIENQQEIKSFGLTQKIRQTLYQKMEEVRKSIFVQRFSAGIPMLCSKCHSAICLCSCNPHRRPNAAYRRDQYPVLSGICTGLH